jgi:hypothetical protein
MASYTWIGAAGGLYATTTNWSPTGLPAADDDIVFTGDASPSVGTTARTIRNLTVNGGTVTFAGTGAFTIQGDISNAGTLNMNTFITNFTGGTNQTLNLGTNSFTSCTVNKTVGTSITLGAAWNVTGTAAATLTITAGNMNTQGYTVTCQLFAASGNTDRTIDLAGGAIYVTGTSGTLWNTSHTTAAGTSWTKFARSGAAYIQPSGGTTAIITGGGIAGNYTAGATFNGVPPTFQLGNNKTYTTTGQFENLEVNGNFAGTSTPQIWGNLTGSPVSYNNVTTCNPVIIGRTGITNTVSWRAQVTSYTTQNPLSGTPTFTFDYARAVTFTLTTNTSTYNLWIDGNDTTGAAWQTAAFTVTCNGNSSTYNENIIRSTSTLTYSGQGTGSTYNHYSFYDNSTTSAYTLAGNAATVHNIYSSFDTIGTVNFNFGILTLQNTSMYCRIFRSVPTTTSQARTFNFQGYWIYVNGNHRAGTNGTGTLTITSATTATCSSDSDTQGGGFWLQTTGTCATGLWSDAKALRYRIEALNGVTLNASISGSNLRSIEFFGPVNFAAAQTVNLINNNSTIYWNESGAAFNLTNLTATIACATGGTFDILRNGSSLGNANWRLGTLSTLNTSLANDQTVTILGYIRTLSLTKNTGTFNLNDLDFAQSITCSGGVDTNYYYNYVRTANPFTTTWTPITGTAVTAAVAARQVSVKSTNGSGSGASFNVTKAVNQTTYASATITVASLGSGYVVGDTITLSGASLGGADGTHDLTFTIASALQASLGGISDGARLASISGNAVGSAQTRTNVAVKSTNGSGTGALFSVTKTGAGSSYFNFTTIIRTTDGSGYNYGDTIVLSGSQLGGVDGTNDLTFIFGQGTVHYVTGDNNFICKNILDHTIADLEIAGGHTMYCRTFQSISTTNIRNWRWNGFIETSGTGLISIGSAGDKIRGNFLDTYSGGFRAIGTGANAFGTNVTVNAPRVYLGNNDGSVRTYTSVNGNISHLIFNNNEYIFSSASGPTVYGNCSFINTWYLDPGTTWTNLTVNWQPIRNGADLQLHRGPNALYYEGSPSIPAITLNTPLGIADAGATITMAVKCNTFTSTTTHNYTVNTYHIGMRIGTSINITGNNCTFNFDVIGAYNAVPNPTFTLGSSTSTNNVYNIGQGFYLGPFINSVDFTQLGGTVTFLYATTIRDYTFTGPGTLNLSSSGVNLRNFSSSNSNARTLNFNNIMHALTGVPTISTGTNLVVQNPGGFDVNASGIINLSGVSAAVDNNFNIGWLTSCTFTTGSGIRNLILHPGAVLSTSSAITVNIRGTVTQTGGYDGIGGTGPFTGMTISFPQVVSPGGLNQAYDVITYTVMPSVTVLGSCTVSGIRTTTLTLSPGSGYTAIFNPSGHVTTLTCGGSNGGTVTLNSLTNLSTIPTTVSFTGGATYNLNGLTASATSVSCGGTAGAVYNISNLDLTGVATTNQLLFDGAGTLNVGTGINLGRFAVTTTTPSRTLNFSTNNIEIKASGVLNYTGTAVTVLDTTLRNLHASPGSIYVTGDGCTLTAASITETSALNLRFNGSYSCTLGTNSFNWRNIETSGSYFTNASLTLSLYRDGRFTDPPDSVLRWLTTSVNTIGSGGYQFISGYWLNAVNTNSNSTVVFNDFDYGYCRIRNINLNSAATYMFFGYVHASVITCSANAMTVIMPDTVYNGSIATQQWICPDSSNFTMIGEGVMRGVGQNQSEYVHPAIYTPSMIRHGDITPGGTGINLYEGTGYYELMYSLLPYRNTIIKYFYYNYREYTPRYNSVFTINQALHVYSNDHNLRYPGNIYYGPLAGAGYFGTSGSYSTTGWSSGDAGGIQYNSTNENYLTLIFPLPSTGTYYFEITTVTSPSNAFQIGIQSIPGRYASATVASTLGYGSGTTATGNNPVFGITSTAFQAVSGTARYVIINCDTKTVRWNSATETSWSGIGTVPAFLAFYDNSITTSWSVNVNWGPVFQLDTATGFNPFTHGAAPQITYGKANISIQSEENDSSDASTVSQYFDIVDTDVNLQIAPVSRNWLRLGNVFVKSIKTHGKTIATRSIQTTGSADFANSTITFYNTGTILDAGNVINNSDTTVNYATFFYAPWPYYYYNSAAHLSISAANSANINLANSSPTTSFTIESWIRPSDSVNQIRNPQGRPIVTNDTYAFDGYRGLIVGKSNYTGWDWELYLSPIYGNLCFRTSTATFDSGTKPYSYQWNYIAAVYDGTNLSLYLNGNRVLNSAMSTVSHTSNLQTTIGYNYYGYMSNLRIVKAALYSGTTMTVPTGRLSNIENTLLLLFQNNNNNDSSTPSKPTVSQGILSNGDSNLFRFIAYPYDSPMTGEIIVSSEFLQGDRSIIINDNSFANATITNNSQFTHSGNGEGTGWLTLAHTGNPTVKTIRTGSGNFSKGFRSS